MRMHFLRRISCAALIIAILLSFAPPALAFGSWETDLQLSPEGMELIKRHEGFRSAAYRHDTGWYIGYGTACGKDDYPDGITEAEAEALLLERADAFGAELNAFLREHDIGLTQYQFDALMSFTYTLGTSWLGGNSRLRRALLAGEGEWSDLDMINNIGVWCHIEGKIVGALARRRVQEACLFLFGDYSGEMAESYTYLMLDGAGGSIDTDVVFYLRGDVYGELPGAEREGMHFSGWRTAAGHTLSPEDIADEPLSVTAVWADAAPWENPYTDVAEGAWYYDYIKELSRSGVVNGYPDGTFRPAEAVTWGAALKLIMLAAGYDEQEPQEGGHWASGYQYAALYDGLLEGLNEGELNDVISRLSIAVIAARALGLAVPMAESPFADIDDRYVTALYKAGIVEGSFDAEGSRFFKPEDGITRAEISAIILRIQSAEIVPTTITYAGQTVHVLDSVPVNSYDKADFYRDERGRVYYSGIRGARYGMDISSYQPNTDWERAAADGIDFVMLRVGYRGYGQGGTMNLDKSFHDNIRGALAAGLDVGVYFFSQAVNVREAVEEAEFLLREIRDYEITWPVVYDWEYIGVQPARTDNVSTATLCDAANTFCAMVAEAGYTPMIYFNAHVGYTKYDLSKIMQYDFWLAEYRTAPEFYYDFQLWQYTSSGSVDGVEGKVDMDISFVDYSIK